MSIDVPRNSNDIRAELNELNSLIINHETMIELYPEDTALKVAMKQLFDRKDALVREIRASKQNEVG